MRLLREERPPLARSASRASEGSLACFPAAARRITTENMAEHERQIHISDSIRATNERLIHISDSNSRDYHPSGFLKDRPGKFFPAGKAASHRVLAVGQVMGHD